MLGLFSKISLLNLFCGLTANPLPYKAGGAHQKISKTPLKGSRIKVIFIPKRQGVPPSQGPLVCILTPEWMQRGGTGTKKEVIGTYNLHFTFVFVLMALWLRLIICHFTIRIRTKHINKTGPTKLHTKPSSTDNQQLSKKQR